MRLLVTTCYGLYALSLSTLELGNYLKSNTQYIHKAFLGCQSFVLFYKTEQVKRQHPPLPFNLIENAL